MYVIASSHASVEPNVLVRVGLGLPVAGHVCRFCIFMSMLYTPYPYVEGCLDLADFHGPRVR